MTVLTIGCSRNHLADGTVVNFQVTPIALLSNRGPVISRRGPKIADIGAEPMRAVLCRIYRASGADGENAP